MQERLKKIKKELGSKEVGKVTVDMVIGGMRGITVLPRSGNDGWRLLWPVGAWVLRGKAMPVAARTGACLHAVPWSW